MNQQIKVKDIAQMAGVSAGTVDRVLHNRGNVSGKSREAIESVLDQVGYKYNIHTSAVSLRKKYRFVICIPFANKGEYWESIQNGIEKALDEYSDVMINAEYIYYDQFDVYSCRKSYSQIMVHTPDAVILGPTFITETQDLCKVLDKSKIPYIFLDSIIKGTFPIASFSTNQEACGRLLGKIVSSLADRSKKIVVFSIQRVGNLSANNSVSRRNGLESYMKEIGQSDRIINETFSINDNNIDEKHILEVFSSHDEAGIALVMNSNGYILADILKKNHVDNVKVLSFDLTENNIRCLNEGSITVLLCQRPELQGFYSITSAIKFLLYKQKETETEHIMPIDIVMKENLPFYKEILSF